MSALVSILGLVVLFVGYGLLNRGRDVHSDCGACGHRDECSRENRCLELADD